MKTEQLSMNGLPLAGWLRRCIATLLFCAACSVRFVGAQPTWPTLNLPEGLATYAIGKQVTVNGMPMRLTGFVSPQTPQMLMAAFRRSLGQPLVETSNGGKAGLGRAIDGFYITVQIEAARSDGIASTGGSKGTIAVADMQAMSRNHEQQRLARARLLDRLPAGSTIASDMDSEDNGKSAHHIVIVNTYGPQRNRDAVVAMLEEDGYVLEREVRADSMPSKNSSAQMAGASTLYFNNTGKEAMAVITRTGERTAIVLNIVAMSQADK